MQDEDITKRVDSVLCVIGKNRSWLCEQLGLNKHIFALMLRGKLTWTDRDFQTEVELVLGMKLPDKPYNFERCLYNALIFKNMKKADLARSLNVSRQYINQMFKTAKPGKFADVLDALGMTVQQFLALENLSIYLIKK